MLLVCGLTLGCTMKGQTEPARTVFEIRYTNHAKAFTWRGLVVDSKGNVFEYDASSLDVNAYKQLGPGKDVATLVSDRFTKIDRVKRSDLNQKLALVAQAAKTELEPRKQVCYDYGQVLFLAHSSNGEQVTLFEAGDWTQTNPSTEAKSIVSWLQSLSPAFQSIMCQ